MGVACHGRGTLAWTGQLGLGRVSILVRAQPSIVVRGSSLVGASKNPQLCAGGSLSIPLFLALAFQTEFLISL